MKNYQAGLTKEAEWIDDAYTKLQTQMPTEIKPKEQLDQTRVSPPCGVTWLLHWSIHISELEQLKINIAPDHFKFKFELIRF